MYPILEFDPAREAVINPKDHLKQVSTTDHCVVCFFHDLVAKLAAELPVTVVSTLKTEAGDFPIYELDWNGRRVAFYLAGVGAPCAGALFEEAIARGYRKFVACGSAGVIDQTIPSGHLVVPTAAVRDEGTSYHYLPPAAEVAANPDTVKAVIASLTEKRVPFTTGKTWTTDGFYRETRDRIARRRAQGCLTVEMEAAALFAIAEFRGVQFSQLLYAGDDVGGETWDRRDWKVNDGDTRSKLFELAVELCLEL